MENALHITPDEKPVDQRATARAVTNIVHAESAAITFYKSVRVMPERVGAAKLDVHKLVRRIPSGDLGAPADGQAVDADAVVDECPGIHRDGCGGNYIKAQPGRGQ